MWNEKKNLEAICYLLMMKLSLIKITAVDMTKPGWSSGTQLKPVFGLILN